MSPTMEEPPLMNQPTMEEELLTCTVILASLLTMTLTPGNPMSTTVMTPMLHQATPDNLEEFTDADE